MFILYNSNIYLIENVCNHVINHFRASLVAQPVSSVESRWHLVLSPPLVKPLNQVMGESFPIAPLLKCQNAYVVQRPVRSCVLLAKSRTLLVVTHVNALTHVLLSGVQLVSCAKLSNIRTARARRAPVLSLDSAWMPTQSETSEWK